MKSNSITQLLLSVAVFALASAAYADESLAVEEVTPPKTWEFGLGVGAVTGPDYRGSTETRTYVAPIPYVVYRGKFIQSDRDGVRGQFKHTDNYEFTLSLSANVTPESHKNSLRNTLDLPELGSTLELGPALNINLTGANLREGWVLSIPVRGVFAIGGDDTGHIGYVFQPQLMYRQHWQDFNLTYRSSLSYASADYHDYYYSINADNANQEFTAYQAKAGYSGWANQIAIGRQFGDWNTGLFIRHDYLGKTEFLDSPLIQTRSAVRGGLAIIWVMK